ncbi:glucuronyl hydrolase [Mucilaginibacter sp. PPCGB 2223]|uniref:glycoside hydrolase family 88 protein n=1 Tax=Mucilaginibacter sp. PPCGB 2223 TaxID=1886027 RepID=UPI000824299B|nr:glycoside hydrolase family 88 protein [Mucilaginibacter sp. PPCGB 2223]OCX52506.1 glucuronyl hydrolase [Mucilaginibacter sp. PPCGB 2223]
MRTRNYLLTTAVSLLTIASASAQKVDVKKQFANAANQVTYMLSQIPTADTTGNKVSPRTFENGKFKLVKSSDWTSGFFPGELWFLYDYTRDPKWKQQAEIYTAKIQKEQYNKGTHDLGFMINCSFGNAYRLTDNEAYKKVLIQAAKSLSTRFNPKTGVIRSWDHNADQWKNPVIIDNMMNLELLFKATKLTGDSSFYKIAVSHADHTLKNHFRADYSSYHVVDYDPETGAVIKKQTHQGYSDESAWARGQAWGLYGYTMCYRETHDRKYLEQAQHIAKFIFSNPTMPKDLVPFWDYNDPQIPNISRDASAAAITASALYELSGYVKNSDYREKADKILSSLSSSAYLTPPNQDAGFILLHSTGHRPAKSEIDVPINYADYYYLEALLRSTKR